MMPRPQTNPMNLAGSCRGHDEMSIHRISKKEKKEKVKIEELSMTTLFVPASQKDYMLRLVNPARSGRSEVTQRRQG